ncbi:leucyl aminopeptidase [Haematobacter massiliensis]|uniref:Cytochrome C oxidase subunit II n=1 Tax=Haematobacter massiliensis TaxID=195105 RepID=A0A086XZG5_9RHOB|nr:leucyl aminopeptidase family protein [Haematobacter massiliensis]KFI27415.1 cytochrome C oxidase subunit II [Haematobacter massiliensis]OWJ70833.1 leucyl aminopeptidase [Haematobacter massiliensis]OWJ84845.1 leucyl aminopeptidase [Haematobacter massiliensis]QBJ23863.1 leucyl aminopeptidase family protein [Haematobacter massiliensis]
MSQTFAADDGAALPLHLVEQQAFRGWLEQQPPQVAAWLTATGFEGRLGDLRLLPGTDGAPLGAVLGLGDAAARKRGRFAVARAVPQLPARLWKLEGLAPEMAEEAALGWLFAGYSFDRYRPKKQLADKPRLVAPAGIDAARLETLAASETMVRDLINTPASDMGPEELELAFLAMAAPFRAETRVIRGEELLAENLPMIHAVGRASPRAPRLLDLRWGERGPKLTLVGKGVCFDTGGLDLKPSSSMLLMKKDMGGAANVMGLARSIMALGLPVQLRVLVPAVENAVGGSAFRPKDILTSRKGLTVEVNNTDAEGRLVLADALALADEEQPDLVISMATLTGAARVALGPDVPPFFTDDDGLAAALTTAGERVADPIWRLPFWEPYEEMIEPGIADLDNAPSGGMAGAITAALFLRRFVAARYAHFDIYGWQPAAAPARTKGGTGQAGRAILSALPKVLSL